MEILNAYYDHSEGNTKPICAGPGVIVGWWVRDIESKVLAGSGVIVSWRIRDIELN